MNQARNDRPDATPTLSTEWSASLGLAAPIVCAPMGGAAGGRLASAVSRAGALGMIGLGSAGSPAVLARELAALDAAGGTGGAPFGIGVVDWVVRRTPELFDDVLAARPALVSVGFTDGRFDWVERVHEIGALAVTQVYEASEAVFAVDAGVDVIVARGAEGGGHGTPRRPMLVLLDAVLDAVDVPVLAAGGIASGRGVAAVLAAGAAGAWVGTAFLGCPETLMSDASRRALLEADGLDTVNTRVADAALALPWPPHFPERVIRTAFADEWRDDVEELADGASARARSAREAFADAVRRDDPAVVPIDAGEGVGMLTVVRPAADVVADLTLTARTLLGRWA